MSFRLLPACVSQARRAAAVIAALASTMPPALAAQEKPTVPAADYGRWENLGAAVLSPEGEWIAYRVTRVDGTAELRIREVEGDSSIAVVEGTSPRFSADGGWLAWATQPSPEERERLQEARESVRNGLEVLNFATGERSGYEEVSTFAFDAEGRFLALHGYPPEEPEGKGADLRVVDLAAGSAMTFGNVGEFAWSESGSLLAQAIATGGPSGGNGVQVFDASTGRIRTLDSSESAYRQLSWRARGADLAVLRSVGTAADDGAPHGVLAWTGLDGDTPDAQVLEADAATLPEGHDVVHHRRPVWSDDGAMISFGLRPAEGEEEDADGEEADGPEASSSDDPGSQSEAEEEEPELPGVQIWHSSDVRIYPQQTASEAADARRTLLAVWHLSGDRVVPIGTHLRGNAQLLTGWRYALEDLAEPYGWGEMFGRPYHDVWRIDVQTGDRERVLERVRYEWPSAGGGYLVSFDGEAYTSLDLATGASHDLTSTLPAQFADTAYDTPTDVLPPHWFFPAWLEDDAGVLLYDDHDVWRVGLDGSGATRLTEGAADRVTHRVASLGDDETPGLDPDEPIYFTLHGEWSEQRGFGRVMPDGSFETLVLEDRNVFGLQKADSADVYSFRSMAFDDPTDHFVAGPRLRNATQVSESNPFFSDYAWGRSEVVDYTSETGRPLQAVLYYPADYVEGEPVPTIVYTYEMRSQTVHTFQAPSERSYYNFTAWTQHGYAVLQPDIVYEAREPGMSALASVRAAVQAVVDRGVTDPDAVGLIGHSWGGYQATFLPTRTDIFAASVAGAPLTDFVSFMGQIHWNPGMPELSHWETGQARMEVPFWEDPDAHRRNSPIHKVHEMETPLLMAFGNEDGVVDWDQGTEFYNFARRAGKQMVMLVYEGEDHGFRQEANQVDYHRRILEWFGHYLNGDPAPAWITEGVALDALEDEKRRVAGKGAPGG